jgi:hypothetical protein
VSTSGPRRLISASLLLGICLAITAPLFTLYAASHSTTMSCCKRGKGACCHRSKSPTGSKFAAGSECARQCSLTAASAQFGTSLVPALLCLAFASALYAVLSTVEAVHSQSTAYLAFLYQLPPPVAIR